MNYQHITLIKFTLQEKTVLFVRNGSLQLDLTNLIEKDMKRMTENLSSVKFFLLLGFCTFLKYIPVYYILTYERTTNCRLYLFDKSILRFQIIDGTVNNAT